MNVVSALELIENVELRAAFWYQTWAKRYELDQEASILLYKIYLEEKAHAQLAKYCKKLVAKNGKEFPQIIAPPIDEAALELIEKTAKQAKTLKEALQAALHLELAVGESYLSSELRNFGDGFVKQSLDYLGQCGHAESLTAFLEARGWAVGP